jgi:glycosyltransferase involved in cell wall biosynthesis
VYPNSNRKFNTIYLASSNLPLDWAQLIWLAKRKSASLVLNQNGVGYYGWYGRGWEKINAPLKKILHSADYVFYQSNFCKLSADIFLGERLGPWEILYNPVDTQAFSPSKKHLDMDRLVILIAGSHSQFYRVQTAVQTLSAIIQRHREVKLIIAGRLQWTLNNSEAQRKLYDLAHELKVENHIQYIGPYTQKQAPEIFNSAHILIHPQYNDACPSLVLEAMACGLPVVYSHSGGTPELVGEEAGIGIPSVLSWDEVIPPSPEEMAEAVIKIAERRQEYSKAARQRAINHFDIEHWIKRHQIIFSQLIQSNSS